MRTPHRKRPRKDDRLVPGPDADLSTMAGKVSYVISTEHKDYLTIAGPGNLRSDASACHVAWTSTKSRDGCERRCATARSAPSSTVISRAMRGSGSMTGFTRPG